MRIKKYLVSHYDLDGVTSDIILSQFINFEKKFQTAYEPVQMEKMIDELSKIDHQSQIYIADVNFKMDQFEKLLSNGFVTLISLDHHLREIDGELEELKKKYNSRFFYLFDTEKCGCYLCLDFVKKSFKEKYFENPNLPKLKELVAIVNVYDLWKTESKAFKLYSYPLNDLYWYYSYDQFFERFKNGYNLNEFDENIIQNINIERKDYLEKSYNKSCQKFDNLLLLVHNAEGKYFNDYTVAFPNFDFYLIMRHVKNDAIGFSFRVSNNKDCSFKNIIEELKPMQDVGILLTIGGHEKAGGMAVKKDKVEEFISFLYDILLKK